MYLLYLHTLSSSSCNLFLKPSVVVCNYEQLLKYNRVVLDLSISNVHLHNIVTIHFIS